MNVRGGARIIRNAKLGIRNCAKRPSPGSASHKNQFFSQFYLENNLEYYSIFSLLVINIYAKGNFFRTKNLEII